MFEGQSEHQPLLHAQDVDATEVYPIIQMIRRNLTTMLTIILAYAKQSIILTRPSLTRLSPHLISRTHWSDRSKKSTVQFSGRETSLSRTRATLCEILAIRALREHAHNMLELALAITTTWSVYSGAPSELLERAREERDDDLEDRVGNAIEMAILSQAKRFTNSSACQKVIDGIWSGKIVYQADSSRSILSDTYKRTPIHFYDPHKAPLLDHYRLKVPAIRSVFEYTNFLLLFILFIVALEFNERDKINVFEAIFMIYALGFTLEKVAAMQEHGIQVYFKGTWNGFDLAFITCYCAYAILSLVGVYNHRLWARLLGVDFLALIAVLMFPRLAFVTFKNNVMVLSLRAMMTQFVALMCIATFCFGGFMYALWTLSRNQAGYSAGQIAWWMLDLWFGLDASGFENASAFHPIFGPILMVAYACLSNTLLLTILVSILSNTFSTINDDATAEAMYRRVVSTIEGVKADSLFSYQPPINLIALCMMLPASYVLTPRWFHKVNVFLIRLTNFPILLSISLYERQAKLSGAYTFYETVSAAADKVFDTLPRAFKRLSEYSFIHWGVDVHSIAAFFEGLTGPDADIDAIFELGEEHEESALDTQEDGYIYPIDITRQRRLSQMSRRRVSHQSEQSTPSRSQKSEHAAGPSSVPLPRQRVDSGVSRGLDVAQTTTSPLAQIFQPLVIDENHSDEHPGDHNALVSYGPASRRRLSSMHRRFNTASHADPFSPHPPTGMKRFPNLSPVSRSGALTSQPLSESPDAHSSNEPMETAEEIEEGGAPPASWQKRLDNIEERQRRIEDLLLQLSTKLG
ncbi:hypothetical protein AcV7_007322 [Taiwanofungus camphoratus]|nr:hypothetical protein AcV7_007322 [Antrodia cinnamomea]